MKQRALIDMAADRGAYICQSQSLNLFLREPTFSQVRLRAQATGRRPPGLRPQAASGHNAQGSGLRAQASGLGPRASGLRPQAQGSRLRAQASGHRPQGTGLRAQGSGHRAQGTGLRAQGSGLRAQGSGLRLWVGVSVRVSLRTRVSVRGQGSGV